MTADPFHDGDGELSLVGLSPWRRAIGNPNDRPGRVVVDGAGRRWVWTRRVDGSLGWLPMLSPSSVVVAGAPRAMVGALTVSAEERNAMQAQVSIFQQDVDKAEVAESSDRAAKLTNLWGATACAAAGLKWDCGTGNCVQEPDPSLASYECLPGVSSKLRQFQLNRLRPFLVDWELYLTSAGAAIGVATFEALKLRFQQLVGEWTSLGQSTTAVPPAVSTPGGAFETATEWLPWVLGAGVLGVVLYLASPLIGAAIAARR